MILKKCLYEDTIIKTYNDIGKYYQGCEWAPDGTCIMTISSDNYLYIYNTPEINNENNIICNWNPVIKLKHSELIYDYQWNPKMISDNPKTCFFATCSRDQPIQIYDAYNASNIHSFLCVNYNQCVISPISLKFKPDGLVLIGGFKKKISFFDMVKLKSAGEMECFNLNSLISCISFAYSNVDNYENINYDDFCLMACGSYDSKVGIYDYYTGENVCIFNLKQDIEHMIKNNINNLNNLNNSSNLNNSNNLRCGGITKVIFKKIFKIIKILWSNDKNIITCGTRQCDWIVQYDLRNSSKPLKFLYRPIKNNQKFSLIINKFNNSLISSSMDGFLYIYDLNNDYIQFPTKKIHFHNGVFTGCDINPYLNLLCTTSGCRIFDYPGDTFINKENTEWNIPDSKICLWSFDY